MTSESKHQASDDSIRAALDEAWREHQHVRDQTWKALQLVAALAAGFVTLDAHQQNKIATTMAGSLVIAGALFGLLITWHHRKYEQQKFTHIMNLQKALGLIHQELIPPDVRVPDPLTLGNLFSFRKWNSAKFIWWMNLLIIIFSALFITVRWLADK